jgi:hypothetical protein
MRDHAHTLSDFLVPTLSIEAGARLTSTSTGET